MTKLDIYRKKLRVCESALRARLKTALLGKELNRNSCVAQEQVEEQLDYAFETFWAGHQDALMILGQTHATKTKADGIGSIWGDFIEAFDTLNRLEREALKS